MNITSILMAVAGGEHTLRAERRAAPQAGPTLGRVDRRTWGERGAHYAGPERRAAPKRRPRRVDRAPGERGAPMNGVQGITEADIANYLVQHAGSSSATPSCWPACS